MLLLGSAERQSLREFQGLQFKHFGYVEKTARLREIYAAADIFLNCTLADNFPLSVLESLACGTPVLGFRTGGLPEMIDDGQGGALVETGDVSALASLLLRYLSGEIGGDWRDRARAHVVAKFSLDRQLRAHLALYQDMAPRGMEGRSPA